MDLDLGRKSLTGEVDSGLIPVTMGKGDHPGIMQSLRREGNCRRPAGEEGECRGDTSNLEAQREENVRELRSSRWNDVACGWSLVMRLPENLQQHKPDCTWSKWEIWKVLSRMELTKNR